jgi:hypothetical protein
MLQRRLALHDLSRFQRHPVKRLVPAIIGGQVRRRYVCASSPGLIR